MALPVGLRLRCANDDGGTAVGSCASCGDAICDVCIARRDGESILCRDCALNAAVTGVGEKQAAQAVVLAGKRSSGPGRTRKLAGWGGLTAVALVLGLGILP